MQVFTVDYKIIIFSSVIATIYVHTAIYRAMKYLNIIITYTYYEVKAYDKTTVIII